MPPLLIFASVCLSILPQALEGQATMRPPWINPIRGCLCTPNLTQSGCYCTPRRICIHSCIPVPCPPDLIEPNGRFNSNSTVHGGPGTCKRTCSFAAAEGFSFCDLFQPFYREGRWYDWDLCSMCYEDDNGTYTFATPYGNECLDSDRGCSNSWENRASESPRCQIINSEGPALDWCTTCVQEHGQGSNQCAIFREDDRSGKEAKVNYGLWQEDKQTSPEQ